jgi:hypothetical protein
MKSASDAAAEIAARNCPVIYVDTCSILDLTTRGLRDNKFDEGHARAATDLVGLAYDGKVTIVLSGQVLIELGNKFAEVRQEAIGLVTKINNQMLQLNAVLRVYGHAAATCSDISGDTFAATIDRVVNSFVAAAIHSQTTTPAKLKAADRVIIGRAPAGNTKQSFKDCLVLESCYETLMAARALGFSASAHFLSSNITEYTLNKRELHPDLAVEFSALGLQYAITFAELRYRPSIKDL